MMHLSRVFLVYITFLSECGGNVICEQPFTAQTFCQTQKPAVCIMEIVHIHDQQSILRRPQVTKKLRNPQRERQEMFGSVSNPRKPTVVIMNVVHTHDTCPFGCFFDRIEHPHFWGLYHKCCAHATQHIT